MKNQAQDGRVLTFLESQLVHPTHSDGLVNGSDPVLVGRLAGVAYQDAAATTDSIHVQMDGVFNLSCSPVHGFGVGETVYADETACVLSDDSTGLPFGVTLDALIGTGTIRVRLFGQTPGATGTGS